MFESKNRKLSLSNSKYDKTKTFKIADAVKLVKEISNEKFDSSFRVSFNLNVDPRHANQQLRGMLNLPHGSGKQKRVLAIVEGDDIKAAKNAGAQYVGGEEMLTKIEKENWFDFDVIVTTPSFMPKFAKFGKVLGPKGLMPNPKLGTVTTNVAQIISELIKGKVEYRVDKDGNINLLIGKKSFKDDQLIENYMAAFNELKKVKPSVVKGNYFLNIVVSTTMSPGVKVLIEA